MRSDRSDALAKDAEIVLLRRQLAVLHRQVGRTWFTGSDRGGNSLAESDRTPVRGNDLHAKVKGHGERSVAARPLLAWQKSSTI